MSKRNRGRDKGMFESLEDAPTLEETSDAIFSSGDVAAGPPIRIKSVEIYSIYADRTQPRRVIPSEVRGNWQGDPQQLPELFTNWLAQIDAIKGYAFDLDAYLKSAGTERSLEDKNGEEINPDYEPVNAIEASFLRLAELAASIRREGLTNPISISRTGKNHIIETGERRWLAYHLLNLHFASEADEDWSKIPARLVSERSVWRQASENNARKNLNAVARARQLAILLMDLHGWDKFQPIDNFEYEQDFYAQVEDGNEWRVPRGKGEQLLNAIGLNNQTQLRQYRSILRADRELWQVADDNDLSEFEIRTRMQELNEAGKKSHTVTGVTVSSKNSPLEQVLKNTQKINQTVEKRAERAKGPSRQQWLELARQQADWWANLANRLEDE